MPPIQPLERARVRHPRVGVARAAQLSAVGARDLAQHRDGPVADQRLRGAFYTPDDLATVLTRWALASRPGTVLDPSYGGCSFVRAAVGVLREMRANRPRSLVYGVDIDPACVDHANGLLPERNHLTADFLDVSPGELRGLPFRAIVGNPPYVRHHWLRGRERSAARSAAAASGIRLPATASTWAYFVIHALRFLAPDGRLALLLPEALLQADYARPVRDALQRRFADVLLVHLRDRIFNETDEPVVVLAAHGTGPGILRVHAVRRAGELARLLHGRAGARPATKVTSNARVVDSAALALLDDLSSADSVAPLGQLATIRIGFVTGANHFFVRSRLEASRAGIPARALVPVVARTQWLSGLNFTHDDHSQLTELGRRTVLVRPAQWLTTNPAVDAWVAQGVEEGVHRRFKCRGRLPWFRVKLGPAPDAFATCSRLGPPLLVLNHAGLRCSNALHAVTWNGVPSAEPEAVSVGVLTSLSALWAEVNGRRYGGGVLKLEPGALRRMPVPLVDSADAVFRECSALIRAGREDAARSYADEMVLRLGLGASRRDVARLQLARRGLAAQRLPERNGGRRA